MEKAPDAFRTISEVADELGIPQHVLRFWETKFPDIKPMKRAGGRRYYRPSDVELLKGIRYLLYDECYRIEGVQGILRDQDKGKKFVQAVWRLDVEQPREDTDEEIQAGADEQLPPDEAARTLFGLLKSPDAPPLEPSQPSQRARPADPGGAEPALTREHVRRLQSALHELSECRRLIDAALKDDAA